ncbi:DinB family protein [Bacillus norwichensis]|uniref:DinB family protein n=1 Tax=Bacillus norwichensis TaxID=2762217 RepID=A0ABR8VQ70_9BACI|nr:DinB family protein [Bacillus norwichensis]MBD8006905.1 DinB family protein [Bacillus norwichensis]
MVVGLQQQAIQDVKAAIDEMLNAVKELPEDTIRWKPSEEEWSIMQVIAHVAEAIPFWLGEIRQIIQSPEEVWGRDHTNKIRLEAVDEKTVDSLTVEKVLKDLKHIPTQSEETLSELTDEQLQIVAPSRNPNFDGKPVQFIIDKLIVGHIQGHNGQIQRNLSKLK